jgi:hypothetical protein
MSAFGDHQEQGEAGCRQQRRTSGEATAVVQQRTRPDKARAAAGCNTGSLSGAGGAAQGSPSDSPFA